jgi:hypothetical protein
MASLTTTVEIRLDAESLAAIQALTEAINRMVREEETDVVEEDAEQPSRPAPAGATSWQT